MYIHCTLVRYIKAAGEMKTKPTQHSVKELRSLGIQPDLIVLRTESSIIKDNKAEIALLCHIHTHALIELRTVEIRYKARIDPQQQRAKALRSLGIQQDLIVLRTEAFNSNENKQNIAVLCDMNKNAVIEMRDVDNLYQVPNALQEQNMDKLVCEHLLLDCDTANMSEWKALVDRVQNLSNTIHIGLVGKYVTLPDAYLSVVEALIHAVFLYDMSVTIYCINSVTLN